MSRRSTRNSWNRRTRFYQLVLLLLVHSLAVLVVQVSANGDESGSADGNGNRNDGQQQQENGGNFFTNIIDRFYADMSAMWTSSPSEWITEYWEVFGFVAAMLLLIVGCHVVMCLDVCCYHGTKGGGNSGTTMADGDIHAGGRLTMTQDEWKEEKEKGGNKAYIPPSVKVTGNNTDENVDKVEQQREEASGLMGVDPFSLIMGIPTANAANAATSKRDDSKPPTIENVVSSAGSSAVHNNNFADLTSIASTTATDTSKLTTKNAHKKMNVLVNEVVSVWSEFLGIGQTKEDDTKYQRHLDGVDRKKRNKKKQQQQQQQMPVNSIHIV